ncbi:protein FAR1-RELATED SEQUENCE 5-like [Silene latifolia]|uniref:protein FAR1-RELATED SEQUENCE 5-like n=1 Tax=Silene latifolia TaxID=37657 RepID=UPI003D777584
MSNSFDLNALYIEEEGENEVIDENETATELLRHAAHVLEGNEDNQPAIEPTIGAEFESGEQFAAFCYTYAYKTGFEIHVRSSQLLAPFKEQGVRRNGVGDKEPRFHMMNKIRFMCSEGNTMKKSSCVTPCKMYVFGKLNHDTGKFVICTCDLVHNHDLNPEVSRHVVNYRHISEYFKARLVLNDRAGIPITRNFNTLVREIGGIHNLHFNGQDARNFINSERRKTALISYEDTESFEWVFEKWMECMGRATAVLLTDQCKAMEGAIKKVFPETKHRLCLWHILQNADKNLKDHPQFPQIDRDLRTLVHESITEEELQDMWDDFMEKYNLRRNKWLRGAWDMRQRWMPVFWKDTFCAGMSSTQRSE